MKKILLAALLSAAFAAHAADAPSLIDISGGVGASTNYIYRGESFSNRKPSVNGNFGLALNLGAARVFGTAEGNSVSQRGDNTRALGIFELGGGFKLPLNASIEGGVRKVNYFGETGTPAFKARDLGYQELFLRGSLPLTTGGYVTASVNHEIANANVTTGHNTFYTLGYQQPLGKVLTVGATAGWKHYDTASTTRFNNLAVNANYALTDKVSLYAIQSFGGRYDTNVKLPNLTSLGVAMKF